MNFAHFIAKRLTTSSNKNKKLPIVNIAIGGIVLGMCVMLLTLFIVLGYREAIYSKILGFSGHIELSSYKLSSNEKVTPIRQEKITALTAEIAAIKKQEPYALLGGVANTKEETEEILLKGVLPDYDWSFLKQHLEKGKLPNLNEEKKSNEILISATLANRLKLNVGDKLFTHFLLQPPRSRAFKIVGIYNTGISDFDKRCIIGDIRQVQKLLKWQANEYTGCSLILNDFDQQQNVIKKLQQKNSLLLNKSATPIKITSIKTLFAHIFDWLDIMNVNVKIILILILVVSSFNMISALLVIILEKTRHIGVLKALGMHNAELRKVFLYKSAYIIGKGMIWGNILGIGLALLQQQFHLIPLSPETYYLSFVPIKIDFMAFLLLNVGVLLLTVCIMILPTMLISRIAPSKVIRFE